MAKDTAAKPAKPAVSKKPQARPVTPPVNQQSSGSAHHSKSPVEDMKDKIKDLTYANKELQEFQRIQEQDSLEIIKSIQNESDVKDRKLIMLEKTLDRMKNDIEKERSQTIRTNEDKFAELTNELHERDVAFGALQGEIGQMKDFKKRKFELMQEVERLKQELVDTELRHSDLMSSLEKKFIKEKMRLQNNANAKIEALATQAHATALHNIKEATKDVYKENIKMVEALRYHIEESDLLSKHNVDLLEQNQRLRDEKEVSDLLVRDKVIASKKYKQQIIELNSKIEDVEKCLSINVEKHRSEREEIIVVATESVDQVKKYANMLREEIYKKTKETSYIKRLAHHVLNQRTELEQFFIEALEHVKSNLVKQQEQKRHEFYTEYNRKLKLVLDAKGLSNTAIRNNFKPVVGMHDYVSVEKEESVFGGTQLKAIKIETLSWSDRERVLRLLFAKMNGVVSAEKREYVAEVPVNVRETVVLPSIV